MPIKLAKLSGQKVQKVKKVYPYKALLDLKKKLGSNIKVFWSDDLVSEINILNNCISIKRYVESPIQQIFSKSKITPDEFISVLSTRCLERDNGDVSRLLDAIHLKEYDIPSIIRKTHGVSYNDPLWFQFEGEEQLAAKDVLIKENLYV